MEIKQLKDELNEINKFLNNDFEIERIKKLETKIDNIFRKNAKFSEIEDLTILRDKTKDLILKLEEAKEKIKIYSFHKILDALTSEEIKEIGVVNLKELKELKIKNIEDFEKPPKEFEIKKPNWLKEFILNNFIDKLRMLIVSFLDGLAKVFFKIDLSEYQNPKKALMAKLIDDKGQYFSFKDPFEIERKEQAKERRYKLQNK
jgi:hypothetical protein